MARRVYAPPDAIRDGVARIVGSEAGHVLRVLRLGVGDDLVVFDGDGGEYDARIASARRGELVATLGQRRLVSIELPAPLVLFQGLAKAPAMDRVLRSAVELGACRVVAVLAKRSVPKAGGHKAERWRRIASEAAAQCGRARVPEVGEPVSVAEALEAAVGCVLMPWEGERQRHIADALAGSDVTAGVSLFVGPEGGWTDGEVEEVRGRGGVTVSLGARILRVDTAAVAAMSLVASHIDRACGAQVHGLPDTQGG